MSLLRRRKASEPPEKREEIEEDEKKEKGSPVGKRRKPRWSCFNSCCWLIGVVCSIWWLLLFLYNTLPASIPQFVTEAITGPMPDPPGVKCRKDGLSVKHPVVFVPGIVTGGLELWEGHQCADGLFRKRLWGGTFGEVYKR